MYVLESQVTSGRWEECSPVHTTVFPIPPAGAVQRYTTRGEPCALPFRGVGLNLTWDCIGGGIDPGYCMSRQGRWEQCSPLVKNLTM